MIYGRAEIENIDKTKCKLVASGAKFNSEFAFTDIIYIDRMKNNLTDDTLKIHVYSKNESNTKNVVLIRKQTDVLSTGKVDNEVLRKEFDSVDDAKEYIRENLSNEFKYAFEFSKIGWEYELDNKRIWVEDIFEYRPTIEVGAQCESEIREMYDFIGIVKELHKSLPEIIYIQKQKKTAAVSFGMDRI